MRRRQAYIVGSVAVVLVVVLAFYVSYRSSLRAVAAVGQAKSFEVLTGQSAPKIGKNLKAQGLIRDANAFVTYVNLNGLRAKLKAGTYSLSPTQTTPQIADVLASGNTLTNRFVVPEGYTIAQIEKSLATYGISSASFKAALAEPHAQPCLASKPASVDLEGYLFPDSYEVTPKTTASELVNTMLDNFCAKVGPEYTTAFAAQGLSLHQALTVASIVEKEVSIAADRPVVAQIFLKRYRTGQMLGSDVTAIYAASLLGVPFDINLNSPYNTRKVVGLPPGPISNPGLSALDAVARPATTDYTYFLTGRDGKTYFAKTYAEHQANIAKYLN